MYWVVETMHFTCEFWGPLERRAGTPSRDFEVKSPAPTIADALLAVAAALPDVADALDRAAVACGERLLHRREPLEAGMRLALLPPVAGG